MCGWVGGLVPVPEVQVLQRAESPDRLGHRDAALCAQPVAAAGATPKPGQRGLAPKDPRRANTAGAARCSRASRACPGWARSVRARD